MMHVSLEIFAAAFALMPIYAIARSVRRSNSPRLRFALVAFLILEARLISMVLIHIMLTVDHGVEELLDFGGDLAVISAFAAAFLYGTRWSPERVTSKPA